MNYSTQDIYRRTIVIKNQEYFDHKWSSCKLELQQCYRNEELGMFMVTSASKNGMLIYVKDTDGETYAKTPISLGECEPVDYADYIAESKSLLRLSHYNYAY